MHPSVIVPIGLAAVLTASGRTEAALLLVAWAVVLVAARIGSGFRFDRWLTQAAVRVGHAIAFAIAAALHLVVVWPLSLVRFLLRRDWPTRGEWTERGGQSGPPSRLGIGADAATAPRRSVLLRSIGLVTVLLAANYALGLVWDTVSPRSDGSDAAPAPGPTSAINVTGADLPRDARVDDPAMGGVEWAEQYFDELNSIRVTYWPFVLFRSADYQGRYVNGSGWTRDSYEADTTGLDEVPLISFYGGSTMFGIGQRDEYTIPSHVARLAAAAGYPVEVRNHGYPGFVSWQEQFLFEHFTASGERPLRAVFYDGLNEVYAQRQAAVIGNPTDTEVEQMGERIATPPVPGQRSLAVRRDQTDLADVIALYNEHSAVARVAEGVGDLFGSEPAGALGAQEAPDPSDPVAVGAAAIEVYERSRAIIIDQAERAGITPAFFWQPVPRWDDPSFSYAHAVERLSEPTESIVDCLDGHEEVYMADEHTNEEGARLVAGCIWEHLDGPVAAWYERRGIERRRPAETQQDDATVEASELADVGLRSDDLGPDWSSEVAVPNLLDMCLPTLADVPAREAGPSFALDGTEHAVRTTTARYDLGSPASAETVFATLADEAPVRECLGDQAIENLGVDDGITWDAVTPDLTGSASGVAAWNGTGFVRFYGTDVRFEFVLVRQGSYLVSHVTLGTEPNLVAAATDRAVAAMLAG